jgi:hypothetical protein
MMLGKARERTQTSSHAGSEGSLSCLHQTAFNLELELE